jgi:hypothetical protein
MPIGLKLYVIEARDLSIERDVIGDICGVKVSGMRIVCRVFLIWLFNLDMYWMGWSDGVMIDAG